ncbi:MAG: hypothetical protein EBU66_17820 [Bacteroidetes bacterium]|jgi:hypothetical protein|nr:hypothetical protein [Bacteroidota bacterium]
MSVPIPTVAISSVPMPQFIPRSRREDTTRDVANARNLELQRSVAPIQQSFFRPEPSTSAFGPKLEVRHNDQKGLASRNKPPTSVPAPSFDPAGPKLVGNVFFDQYAPEYDPRNVVRELRGSVKDDKATRGELESKRILSRGFSSRYVPEGFAEKEQLNSLEAFEQLRPKIDDVSKQYRSYE